MEPIRWFLWKNTTDSQRSHVDGVGTQNMSRHRLVVLQAAVTVSLPFRGSGVRGQGSALGLARALIRQTRF